ncbi:MAG: DUF3015 family protein [Rickettsiales bacterium]|nr:DUF3015 family protein [Rickettsiales bacterium]
MKKILTSAVIAATALTISASAHAGNSAGCGLGSMLFNGHKGLGSNLLAATTNGTSGNQTFGMSTGTLGCDSQDVVKSKAGSLFAFTDANLNELAADSSRGNGEYLESVASIMEVKESDKAHFFKTVQGNFSSIFSSANTNTKDVVASLNAVMKNDKILKSYAI